MAYISAYGESGKIFRPGADVCCVLRPHTAAAAESDERARGVRVLLRGNFGAEPAEDFATPGVSAERGPGEGAARWKVDALSAGDACGCGGGGDFADYAGVAEGGSGDADGSGAVGAGLLRTGAICHSAGGSGSEGERGRGLRMVACVKFLKPLETSKMFEEQRTFLRG